jgi:hypothetical protein
LVGRGERLGSCNVGGGGLSQLEIEGGGGLGGKNEYRHWTGGGRQCNRLGQCMP